MKRILSLITTIMDGLLSITSFLSSFYIHKAIEYVDSFAMGTLDNISNVNPDDVTAGYEVLGRLFVGFGGIFAIVFLWVFYGLCLIATVYFMVVCLLGINAYRKGDDRSLYVDGIIKIVFNVIALIVLIVFLFGHESSLWLLTIYLLVMLILSIWQLIICKAK